MSRSDCLAFPFLVTLFLHNRLLESKPRLPNPTIGKVPISSKKVKKKQIITWNCVAFTIYRVYLFIFSVRSAKIGDIERDSRTGLFRTRVENGDIFSEKVLLIC